MWTDPDNCPDRKYPEPMIVSPRSANHASFSPIRRSNAGGRVKGSSVPVLWVIIYL